MCVPHFLGIEVVPESGQPSGTGGIRAYLSPAPQAVLQAAGCSWGCLSPAPQAVPQAAGCSWGCLSPAPQAVPQAVGCSWGWLSPAPQAVPQAAGCSWGCLSPAPQAVPQAAAAAFSRASLWNRFFNDIEIPPCIFSRGGALGLDFPWLRVYTKSIGPNCKVGTKLCGSYQVVTIGSPWEKEAARWRRK